MTEQDTAPAADAREVEVIKKAFEDNEKVLKTMRAIMFGLPVTDAEKEEVKALFADDELYGFVKKRFAPELDKDTEIGKVQDMWLGAEQMIFGQSEITIEQAIQYKDASIKMTRHAVALLRDPDGQAPNVAYDPTIISNDPLGVQLLTRNQYMRHIESQLLFLWVIANNKKENQEEINKRLEQNSSQ